MDMSADVASAGGDRITAAGSERSRAEQSYLHDLVRVLAQHPAGLRRWSVMRAVRARQEKTGRELPLRFEDEVERAFSRQCAAEPGKDTNTRDSAVALFYRPKDRAGEVWAVHVDKAKAWLDSGASSQVL